MSDNLRNANLDLLRVIAIIMVIVMHSPTTNENLTHSPTMWITSYFTAPCIGLFFMISGALLIPAESDLKSFILRRFKKIIIPTIFWSLFYLFVALISGRINEIEFVKSVLCIPFAPQGHGIMWFMYTLIGCYILIPIVSPYIKHATKNQLKLVILFWIITMCYPYIQEIINIQQGAYNPLYYFGGFFGYMLLGYYLIKYPIKLNICNLIKIGGVLIIISFLPPLLFQLSEIDYHGFKENPFWYLSISVVMMCITWFVCITHFVHSKIYNIITKISQFSFGIYFIHIFIMREILWHCDIIVNQPLIVEIVICSIATLIISYIATYLISKLPFSKYIIGC